MNSIALCFNAYKEQNALPGLLENATQFFDEIVMVSAPPEGGNNDETIDIAKNWGVRVVHDTIENGFGAVRTRCLKESSCSWTMIMDADERVCLDKPSPILKCIGTERWDPETCPKPGLTVQPQDKYIHQGMILRSLMDNTEIDAIQFIRRHWFDFSYKNPTQNWHYIPDWQMRCIRNIPQIKYHRGMHESILDYRTGEMPKSANFDPQGEAGIFFDHYHLWFKQRFEVDQRQEDIRTYDRLHQKIDGSDHPQEPGV